ncbi:MAG: primosomal protein N' [Gammaproteobacteria bacterium]|nr:MAG: primosomal protein N' [Gammaproteobacteria bacterium]
MPDLPGARCDKVVSVAAPAKVFRIAVPAPLRQCFDYSVPPRVPCPAPGVRVRVPFGRRELVGVLIDVLDETPVDRQRLKPVLEVLDRDPVLPAALLDLLRWAAAYYHHPLGEVLKTALPAALRRGRELRDPRELFWQATAAGREAAAHALSRAPSQKKLFSAVAQSPAGLTATQLADVAPGWRATMRRLVAKGWVSAEQRDPLAAPSVAVVPAPQLTSAQRVAVQTITRALGSYQAYVLQGITSSGKTEVYLKVIEQVLERREQALVLVPEIGLTPQLIARIRSRFTVPVAVLHSALSDQERLHAWIMARDGKAPIVLGTRSALFAPLRSPGVIIVDEEHDASYKQQDGFRYHARDVAVMRAHRERIPIVLGSATPSLDSLKNVADGSYCGLILPDRTGDARLPEVRLLDLRRLPLNDGLTPPLLEQIDRRLGRGEQSLLFLNRRGYAPVYICRDCGWLAPCRRCDAKLTLHQRSQRLRCHHCGAESELPARCPECGQPNLHPLGEGTERVEEALRRLFPQARVLRIDRDSTRRKGALEEKLRRVDAGEADILVGTQMLSKGHDFPDVTLVGVLNADQRLYSVDFRASEQMVQQIVQVGGRAGRGTKPGQVWIQTYYPEHPVFAALRHQDYESFARFALAERKAAQYPPYAYLALLRAESPKPQAALRFMQVAYELVKTCPSTTAVEIMEPVPSPMERRAGRYRAQLLVQSRQRRPMHRFLSSWLSLLDAEPAGKRVRWSLDVDPTDMY